MGIANFLSEVLPRAGRPVDLKDFARNNGNNNTRKLRIGIDVSSWIYKATLTYSDMLGDERHLTNHGRAQLLEQQQQAETSTGGETKGSSSGEKLDPQLVLQFTTACAQHVLCQLQELREIADCILVLDGATPPIKSRTVQARFQKRREAEKQRDALVDAAGDTVVTEEDLDQRTAAFRRAGAGPYFQHVVSAVLQAARATECPFLVAPYESDGQLAFLLSTRFLDLIVTEDSDLVAYDGAGPILYKLQGTAGILLRPQDLGAVTAANPQPAQDWMDFPPAVMAVAFCAAGSDYCKNLRGVGIATACRIVREAFLEQKNKDPLGKVLNGLFEQTWERLSPPEKQEYRERFLAALLSFRHPIVYDPWQAKCRVLGERDPELQSHGPYAALLENPQARAAIVGTLVPSPLATFIAEGWISPKTLKPRLGMKLPDYVQDFVRDNNELGEEEERKEEEMETQLEDGDFETQTVLI